ncbi:MAG: DegT/DnrJ/EryC1/StrS family aminotransferase [Chitinophagaceae bacterium]
MSTAKDKIWLSPPHMGGREKVYVEEAFNTNWVAPLGPNVDGFEKALSAFTGVDHAAALTSGTGALHLALIMLGVGYGDEVICQSFTFSASANPIAYQGAVPVFVDSEPDTWNICPKALKEAIEDRIKKGKKPKAIIAVHLYGMPAKMDEIQAIATEFEIAVIEDAAEALGSAYKGKACGSFGAFGVLSFNGNKIITTSGGGALVGQDGAAIQKARFLSTQARDPAPHYQHSHIGYNYRLSNVLAGIGRGQMEVLPQRVAKRRENHAFYVSVLGSVSGFQFLHEPEGHFSNRWLTCVMVDSTLTNNGVTRENIRLALEAENIESRPLWKPLHMQPVFADSPYYGSRLSETLFEKGLCLPSGSSLESKDLERIVGVIQSVIG